MTHEIEFGGDSALCLKCGEDVWHENHPPVMLEGTYALEEAGKNAGAVDAIPLTRSVMFVGDYFSMIVTPTLPDHLRESDESDEDFAVRMASEFFVGYYGWDVAAVSNDIGVLDEDGDFDEF